MNRASISILLAFTAFGLVGHPATAVEGKWPQWRGPDRTGVSRETGLLKSWPAGGPPQLWVFKDAGLGYSGPAIVGSTLYTMGARNGTEFLIAVNTENGTERWSARIGGELKNDWGDGPRGTPTVEGDRVFALGGRGDLICADIRDGRIIWQAAMKDFGGVTQDWGYTESVLVEGDKVICTPGGRKGTILALNKADGKPVWQSREFTDYAQYASTITVAHNGARQIIQLTQKHVAGVSAADGRLLWSAEFPGRVAVIPTPIFHEGHVYVTAGYGVGCELVKIEADNKATEVYSNKVMKNHHGGVILLDGHLYGHSDGGGWVCQNLKTGEEVWNSKSLGKGAIAYADGRFYCLAENDGTVALIEASTSGWKEHGRLKLSPQTTQRNPQGRIWTHPVITGGRLYLRDQELLHCYDVRAK